MPRQITSPSNYPQAVLQQIEQLAHHIAIARKRRGESQLQWARKLGVSQPTMARIERGDPSVAMASYVMCIWLINPSAGLADLIAPVSDHAALEQEVARVRAKARPQRKLKAKTPEKHPSAQSAPAAKALPANAMATARDSVPGASKAARPMVSAAGRAPEFGASTPTLAELARPAFDPMADLRQSLAQPTALSELARLQADPVADIRKSITSTSALAELRQSLAKSTALSELARLQADPMADIRKSLARCGPDSATAQGLAALMLAKPVAKKNG